MCVRAAAATARYEGYELRAMATSCYELRVLLSARMLSSIARLLTTSTYFTVRLRHGELLQSATGDNHTAHHTLYKCTYLHSAINIGRWSSCEPRLLLYDTRMLEDNTYYHMNLIHQNLVWTNRD